MDFRPFGRSGACPGQYRPGQVAGRDLRERLRRPATRPRKGLANGQNSAHAGELSARALHVEPPAGRLACGLCSRRGEWAAAFGKSEARVGEPKTGEAKAGEPKPGEKAGDVRGVRSRFERETAAAFGSDTKIEAEPVAEPIRPRQGISPPENMSRGRSPQAGAQGRSRKLRRLHRRRRPSLRLRLRRSPRRPQCHAGHDRAGCAGRAAARGYGCRAECRSGAGPTPSAAMSSPDGGSSASAAAPAEAPSSDSAPVPRDNIPD